MWSDSGRTGSPRCQDPIGDSRRYPLYSPTPCRDRCTVDYSYITQTCQGGDLVLGDSRPFWLVAKRATIRAKFIAQQHVGQYAS